MSIGLCDHPTGQCPVCGACPVCDGGCGCPPPEPPAVATEAGEQYLLPIGGGA